ncbi:MAG: transcriptional repressor [Actinomycetota bacterium]|nr:transcriptional repressor [Actinomycetota bacterium]
MARSVEQPSDDELAERIRQAGLRATQPRVEVLRVLHEGGHHTASEVVDAVGRRGVDVARMSVYNVLHNLTRVGVIAAVELGPDRTIYELDHGWHHHFVCRRCDRILDVACIVGAKPCLDAGLQGAEIDEAAVTFRGLCPDCATAAKKERRPARA